MAGSKHRDEDSGATRTLHVLLVDDDAAELRRTGLLLLDAGYVVGTRRGAADLFDSIARLQPDLILIDPLLIGLDFAELFRSCRATDAPSIALHSKVLPQVLHGAISFKDVVAVIHKSEDDRDFLETFEELASNLPSRQIRVLGKESQPPAVSGTHLIGSVHALPFERRARRG